MTTLLNNRWLTPLKFAVYASLLTGCLDAARAVCSNHYVACRFYNTIFALFASIIDRRLLFIVGLAYTAYIALVLDGIFLGKSRVIYRTVVLSGCTAAALTAADMWTTLVSIVHTPKPITALPPFCLIGAVILIGRFRGRVETATGYLRWKSAVKVVLRRVNHFHPGLIGAAAVILTVNVAYGVSWCHTRADGRGRPNVVLIMVDTLRADHVGCYGCTRGLTPNIDRFAEGSTRFSRAISQAPWTVPSVQSFLTSMYPEELTPMVGSNPQADYTAKGLGEGFTTLAETLRDAGYTTGAVISNDLLESSADWDQGFDYVDTESCSKRVSSPLVLSTTESWLDGTAGKRFFLFTVFMDPHSPYIKHPDFDFDPGYRGKMVDRVGVYGKETAMNPPCNLGHIRAMYDSEVAYTDHHVGLLLEYLKEQRRYDDSLIIILGDHGEELAEHGGLFHGHSLYQELLSVPLIVKLPHQTEGRVVDGTFPLIDLFPTIIGTLGMDSSGLDFRGKSVPLQSIQRMPDDWIFSSTRFRQNNLRAIQNSEYKYIMALDGSGDRLFNLKDDPDEMHNLLYTEPGVAGKMHAVIRSKEASLMRDRSPDGESKRHGSLSLEQKNRLRSLGYAQ